MRRFVSLAAALFVASNAFAVVPQFWRVTTAEDFLAGELEGFAVTSRGELQVAPAMKKIATFTDPFVLSQASAPNGDRFFGTGNDGKVYRLRGEELKLLFTAPEPEVYAVAYRAGALYAGTSPNGKVYRVDPESGKESVFFDPKQAYIWAIEPLAGGEFAVATGIDGILYRVSAKGEGSVLYDAPDTHIRSLAARPDGSLLAGASAKGRIYHVARDGSAHALFDSPLNEISSIYVDPSGTAWAAAVSNVLPSAAPQAQPRSTTQQQQQQQSGSGETKKESEPSSPSVEVTFSFEDPAGSAAAAAGSAEVYRIHSDGFVETVRKFEREMVYALSGGDGGAVLLATGPNGRIYELRDGELSLIGTVPEKQVVSIARAGASTTVTTTNSGAVYRLAGGLSAKPEFRSAPKDAERFSRFGSYRIEGRNLSDANVSIAFRSGNTRTPDATWSAWSGSQSALDGNVVVPPARYIQWKLTMPNPPRDAAIDAITIAFMNRNMAPQIDAIAVQDPAVVFISSSYPAPPQVVEATNPDEYGIFTSLDTPRERATADQGKRVFRKGFRTVAWHAQDPNGDALRYTLSFRKKGSEQWLRLRENMLDTQINFDTSQFPDGLYELRLVASDALDNPDAPLTNTKSGIEFQVDNTAPDVAMTARGDEITVRITDALSPIGRVEYSADAERWIRITPVDGIADSREETFRLSRRELGGKFVVIRAVDAFYNVATESVTLP